MNACARYAYGLRRLLIPCLLFVSVPAYGARPAAFVDAVTRALTPAEVARGGTVPQHPPVTFGNHVEALTDGMLATVTELCRLITTAEQEILLQVYQWDDNDAAAVAVSTALYGRIARALLEPRLSGPLRIHLVVNGTFPAEGATSHVRLLALIRSLAEVPHGGEHVQVELAMFGGFGLAVLHSKAAVIDGHQALLMTGNLRTRGGLESDFYNAGMVVSGPVVDVLRDDFREARGRSTVYAATVPAVNLPEGAPALKGVRIPMPQGVPAAALTKQAAWWPVGGGVNPQNRAVVALVDTASERIEAMNPALNAAPLVSALTRAALRGVEVHLVLSLNMDRWEQQTLCGGDNAEVVYWMYQSLLSRGGRAAADKLHVHWPSADGRLPAPNGASVNVHAKAAMFDGGCLWLGSMNWDYLSWNTSRELSVAMFADYTKLWRTQLFDRVLDKTVDWQARDLPLWAQHRYDQVYVYARSRLP